MANQIPPPAISTTASTAATITPVFDFCWRRRPGPVPPGPMPPGPIGGGPGGPPGGGPPIGG
ncbi:hypothetical protein DVA86_09905 [Streptomyces armeniacus]|uniref:Uncharacterized protein n=1 Tax=Streptomyces armeniacus TaxID=83291 RepID=A0A345XMP9_9ACTN|nr:hypothetical protein DVA86_09905 [Streptomyces armeniacus]